MSQKTEDVMDLPPLARRTLAAVLEGHLRMRADQVAVRDTERGMSYAALYEEALAFAAGFSQMGVARQEPVLLMLDNHLDFVIAWWALSLTGRVEVPVNTAYKGSILVHVINNSGARVIVADAGYLPVLQAVADRLEHLVHVVVRGAAAPAALGPRLQQRPWAAGGGARGGAPPRRTPGARGRK